MSRRQVPFETGLKLLQHLGQESSTEFVVPGISTGRKSATEAVILDITRDTRHPSSYVGLPLAFVRHYPATSVEKRRLCWIMNGWHTIWHLILSFCSFFLISAQHDDWSWFNLGGEKWGRRSLVGGCRCSAVKPARFLFSTARVRCLAPELEVSEFSMHAARAGRCTWGREARDQIVELSEGARKHGTKGKDACSTPGIGAGTHGTEAWSTGAGTALD
jgi:hypothetical protein